MLLPGQLKTIGRMCLPLRKYLKNIQRISSPIFSNGIEFITAHIPNGSGYGWIKIEHFRALTEAIISAPDCPRILSGDFNEPQAFMTSGQIVSFEGKIKENGGVNVSGQYSKNTPDGIPQKKRRMGTIRALRPFIPRPWNEKCL